MKFGWGRPKEAIGRCELTPHADRAWRPSVVASPAEGGEEARTMRRGVTARPAYQAVNEPRVT